MKTAIGIFCIVFPVVAALWPDIKKRMFNNQKSIEQ